MKRKTLILLFFIGYQLCVFPGNLSNSSSAWAASEEDELFLVAQKAFEDGFYDVAIRYIEQFLQKYPQTDKRIQARLLLGQCFFFQSQYLKAFDIFQELLNYNEFKDATLFWLGETYFKGADYRQAEKFYRQLLELYPDSIYLPQTYYSLGWTYLEQGEYQQAKDTFMRMVKKFPADRLTEDALFKIGECEYHLGSYEIAIQYFSNYVLRFPMSTRHAEAYFYIAESYYYLNNYLNAISYYAKAADISYDTKLSVMSKVSMGWCYLKLEKYDLSEKSFTEAQKLASEKNISLEDVYLGLASLYSANGENTKAKEVYAELIRQFPESPRLAEARLGKANIDYALKDYSQAISEYQNLISIYMNDPQQQDVLEKAYYGLAWTYLKAGDIDSAIKNFETIMSKTESKIVKVSALTQIGDAYQDAGQLGKAIDIYDRILKDFPDSLYTDYVQFRQGIALLKQDKIEAATLSFLSLQTNFPKSKYLNDVKYYLGVAYYKKEDWAQAITSISEYLQSLNKSMLFAAEANYVLALSYLNAQDYKAALTAFEKIIKDFPEQTVMTRVAKLNIAKSQNSLGDTEEAIRIFQEILRDYPSTESAQEAMLWLGDHYFEKGEWESALKYYQDFLKNFPGSDKVNLVYFETGQAFQAQDNFDQALTYYKKISEKADKEVFAKAKLAIADIFSKDADNQSAITAYMNIAQNVPEFQRDAYVKIANIQSANKEYQKVIESYQKALKADKALSGITNVELQFNIGDVYELLNEPEAAIEAYLKIPYLYSKDLPWVVKAYLRVARIFEDTDRWTEAAAIYRKIEALNAPESKYAAERLMWIKEHQQNP
jgi:TolA-binding protein